MNITQVQVVLTNDEPVKAYCRIVIDGDFIIKDLKLVDRRGELIVDPPSRKLKEPCHTCNQKNARMARYCNNCGEALTHWKNEYDRKYDNICHPLTPHARQQMTDAVLAAYRDALQQQDAWVTSDSTETAHNAGNCSDSETH